MGGAEHRERVRTTATRASQKIALLAVSCRSGKSRVAIVCHFMLNHRDRDNQAARACFRNSSVGVTDTSSGPESAYARQMPRRVYEVDILVYKYFARLTNAGNVYN